VGIVRGRMTVDNDEDIVVFLIGARINRWWLLPLALPILSQAPRMLAELQADPDSGLLGVESLGFGGMIQYWKSVAHLERYANDRDRHHQPAWVAFMKKLFKNWAIGVWHETYVVKAGAYESIYSNMPRRGLGKLKPLIPATGSRATAAGRREAGTAQG